MAKANTKPAPAPAPAAEVETKAEQQTNVPATISGAAPAIPAGMPKFKLAKRVTLPTINPGVGEKHIFRIEDAMRESSYKSPDAEKEKPATVCTVVDIDTGVVSLWIVPEVAKKNIIEAYPENGYIGKYFAVQKLPKRAGKRYFDFEIAELEIEE
jgi:hypothetical protein